MTIIKSAKQKDTVGKLFLILAFVWFLFMAVVVSITDSIPIQQALALVSFVAFVVTLIVKIRQLHREFDFRCPDCGGNVSEAIETAGKGGEPILHKCVHCDVLWHVGNIPEPD